MVGNKGSRGDRSPEQPLPPPPQRSPVLLTEGNAAARPDALSLLLLLPLSSGWAASPGGAAWKLAWHRAQSGASSARSEMPTGLALSPPVRVWLLGLEQGPSVQLLLAPGQLLLSQPGLPGPSRGLKTAAAAVACL